MNRAEPRILDYQNLNNYLSDVLEFKQKENAQFSLRAWAIKMGFAYPSTLSELVSAKRKIIPSHIPKILRGLKLTVQEKEYFVSLVYFENAEAPEEKELFHLELEHIRMTHNHEHCFVEHHSLRLHEIDQALKTIDRLKSHLEQVSQTQRGFEKYDLSIQFYPSR